MTTPWPFSVVILTLNEEKDLPGCLASVSGSSDIVVLDSGSTDRTQSIAREAGARVVTRRFDSFAGQRNYAQCEISFHNPWVFHLDADEFMTPELASECALLATKREVDGYYVAPRMIFQGRWIRHCTDFPAWQARFVQAPQFRFIDVGHGQREAPGMRLGHISANYLHNLSSDSEEEWLAKHRRYAIAEAKELSDGASAASGRIWSTNALERRRALKRLAGSIPFRPAARFFYQYFLRGGFLDGRPGFRYCQLLARYEGFVASELRKRSKGPL